MRRLFFAYAICFRLTLDILAMPNITPPIMTALLHDELVTEGFVSCSTPTARASTVVFPNLAAMRALDWRDDTQWRYGLHATPTSMKLEQKLSIIEGGQHTLLFPSGLAAISSVYFALLKSGDTVLVPDNAYGPNRDHADWMARDYGIQVRYYDPLIGVGIEALITPSTKLIWLESPGSVSMEVQDIPAICQVARAKGVLTALDNTWSAGIAFKPFDHGVDISMQALTKYQSGGSDVLMGSLMTVASDVHAKLKLARMRMGWGVSADDCFLVLRSLPTLAMRLAAHDKSARTLAAWLQARSEIVRILHPAFADCPGHTYWQRDFNGAGGLFSVVFHARYSAIQIDAFIERLKLFKIGFSWGGAHSLALPYNVASMRTATPWPRVDWQNASDCGVLVRFYVGLEDIEDLQQDVEQALLVLA